MKAKLQVEGGGDIPCLFNPAELTISKANTWSAPETKGGNAPGLRFQAGQSGTISLSLTLDTTGDGSSVKVHTDKLADLMKVKKNDKRPPWVRFTWGTLNLYECIVERLQVKYTYFASDGTPLRAKADLTLKQLRDEDAQEPQNPTSYTPMPHTMHRVVRGETLDRIAAAHYADSARWRLIAEANAVVDPLAVDAGTLLAIPELPVRGRG
jgi:Contractile injection system tube protein/LysM domain